MEDKLRKELQTKELIRVARGVFGEIEEAPTKKNGGKRTILLRDCLMSGLAIFGLKFPSLLSFDDEVHDDESILKDNLNRLYGIDAVPRDTYLRERLDEVNAQDIRKVFTKIFAQAQRGKLLEPFQSFDGHYVVDVDGTEVFTSNEVHCKSCCERVKDDKTTYYHQILCAAIVHPHQKVVIPFAPEFIMKGDGATKNDCEYNAFVRFIANFRREHPHLKVLINTDALFSRAPIIKLLIKANMLYLLGVKPGSHKYLFEFAMPVCKVVEKQGKNGERQIYRYVNDVPLNNDNPDVLVNFLHYTEIDKAGKESVRSWVTNVKLSDDNLEKVMRTGRARWKIENETFNTLKNQGYQFEHNFGHGRKFLHQVFSMLMLLAFFIDQILEACDALFQKALQRRKRKKRLWSRLFSVFHLFEFESWEDVWSLLAGTRETLRAARAVILSP